MKVAKIRTLLVKTSELQRNSGSPKKAKALLDLAEFLRQHDGKSVSAFVKTHRTLENQAKKRAEI